MAFTYADGMYTVKIGKSDRVNTIMLEPNVAKMPDGGIIVCYTKGGDFEPDLRNATRYRISYDNGRSWSEEKALFQHSTKGVYTPELSFAGGKLYAFPSAYSGKRGFEWDFTSYISTSCDFGKSFTSPRSIGGCLANIRIKDTLELSDRILFSCSWLETVGDYWAPTDGDKDCIIAGRVITHDESEKWQSSIKGTCGVLILDKDGKNPRVRGSIEGITIDAGFCEPMLTTLSDGTIVCLLRSNCVHSIFESRSYDNGESWTEPVKTDIPSAISKIDVIRDSKGVHYLLLNADISGRRSPLSLWISYDDMKTWSKKIDLITSDGDSTIQYPIPYAEEGTMCCYPDGFIDEDRGVICFSWDDRHNIYYSEYKIK
ncbi:MAG: exo-alpha-sialidase [Clostridia bacterium]|nr:exo-alpha-sialidase [Clostridia bacterium]